MRILWVCLLASILKWYELCVFLRPACLLSTFTSFHSYDTIYTCWLRYVNMWSSNCAVSLSCSLEIVWLVSHWWTLPSLDLFISSALPATSTTQNFMTKSSLSVTFWVPSMDELRHRETDSPGGTERMECTVQHISDRDAY